MANIPKIPIALLPFHDKLIDGLDFCKLAYAYFDEVSNKPDGGVEFRERRGPIKDLMEEILPLCRYVHAHYGPGQYIAIQWAGRTKTPDAKFTTTGMRVEMGGWPTSGTLEITQARHPNEHIALEMLNKKGGCFGLDGLHKFKDRNGDETYWSEAIGYSGEAKVASMSEIILKAVQAKVEKHVEGRYPHDTILIVNCALITIFDQNEWDTIVDTVRKMLPQNTFNRIFLVADGYPYSATLYGGPRI